MLFNLNDTVFSSDFEALSRDTVDDSIKIKGFKIVVGEENLGKTILMNFQFSDLSAVTNLIKIVKIVEDKDAFLWNGELKEEEDLVDDTANREFKEFRENN